MYSVTRCHIARGAGAKLSIDIIEKRVKQFIVKTKKKFSLHRLAENRVGFKYRPPLHCKI